MNDNQWSVSPDNFQDKTRDKTYRPWSVGQRVAFAAGALQGARGEVVDCNEVAATVIVSLSGCLPGVFVSVNSRFLESTQESVQANSTPANGPYSHNRIDHHQ
jgi:hypothetical protein